MQNMNKKLNAVTIVRQSIGFPVDFEPCHIHWHWNWNKYSISFLPSSRSPLDRLLRKRRDGFQSQ